MKLHANAALSLTQRRRMVRRVIEQGWTIKAAATAAETSAKTCGKWVSRYRAQREGGLLDRSSAPGEPGSEGRYISGTPHAHPGFGTRNGGGQNDMGVVVLDDPASSVWPGIRPAPLPLANALAASWADGSLKRATITLVGYGVYEIHANGKTIVFDPIARRRTDVTVATLAPEVVKFQAQSRDGRGGGSACYGDSGGPAFLGASVIGLTNGGTPTCTGYDEYQRTDTANARAFLGDFVALP